MQQMGALVHAMVPELSTPTVLLNRFPLFAPVSFVFEHALQHAGACHIAATMAKPRTSPVVVPCILFITYENVARASMSIMMIEPP